MPATDEEAQVAKNSLDAAIKKYFATIEPDVFIDDWALVVHKDSIKLTAEGESVVSTLVPTGQSFHRTAGLLQLAAYTSIIGTK